ncbi:MAG: DUF427 domain-containing protein [Chloroflexi bacterium]|nr:DUF427 domain-containing protein [Chloroflexota bacterium]
MRKRIEPGPGQESVWDYPRPPKIDPTDKLVRVEFNGVRIAETRRAIRVLETSHPPAYYIPREDVKTEFLTQTSRRTFCEFKGQATYWTIKVGDQTSENAGWSYESPASRYAAIEGYLTFYPSRVDACYVDDERVQPQEGDFYGGWITSDIVGPFKGGPGTWGW